MTLDIYQQLSQSFGFNEFRPGQEQTIRQLLSGQSSLAIFPTGSGKSLCYQLTALQLPHLTLVVSPLIALMKDQLAFLASKGINAASIDSSLTGEQHQQLLAQVRAGEIDILMVSVERFKNERFRQFIKTVPISMLVVDEAHCISEWGHNFRPDYLKLPSYQQSLNIPLVLLLTATATQKVKQDMAAKFAIEAKHIVQTGFYRQNLQLTVLASQPGTKEQQLLQQLSTVSGCGIIYVTLQQSAERLAGFLQQHGIHAQAYHAGFDSDHRQQIQHQFMAGEIKVIVATIAFGMGVDKSDIRFVIHFDLPKSIENYSQEIGRAGRDGQTAQCITLADLDGINVLENFIYGDTPELSGISTVIDAISKETVGGRWELQGLSLSTASNIRQLPLRTLLVQLELFGVITPLYAYFAEFKYKFIKQQAEVLAAFDGERREFLQAIFQHSHFKKVWGELDIDALTQDYGAERTRVIAALEYLQEQAMITLESKKMTEVFAVDLNALTQDGLAVQLHQYFSDKERSEISRVAKLVDFFQLEQCLSYHLADYFDDQQAPKKCGHCSVCQGNIVKLNHVNSRQMPSEQQLQYYLDEFQSHMAKKGVTELSPESRCRFLAGLMVPVFSRHKVKQLSGFACCEHIRYQEIRATVARL